ncbi:hypothetical protein An08g09070 [Aspergillus niger]|uniref:Uncharacterized protein n=2 Tax=Aspergillus niger TaxID=5061 RepID=A5AB52_ASPNC|nr:hypothetical protein An08g09070 [Aspergillus niger]CAK96686.1 hypothetical protein An08g09070 [Aspergillus niger]
MIVPSDKTFLAKKLPPKLKNQQACSLLLLTVQTLLSALDLLLLVKLSSDIRPPGNHDRRASCYLSAKAPPKGKERPQADAL